MLTRVAECEFLKQECTSAYQSHDTPQRNSQTQSKRPSKPTVRLVSRRRCNQDNDTAGHHLLAAHSARNIRTGGHRRHARANEILVESKHIVVATVARNHVAFGLAAKNRAATSSDSEVGGGVVVDELRERLEVVEDHRGVAGLVGVGFADGVTLDIGIS